MKAHTPAFTDYVPGAMLSALVLTVLMGSPVKGPCREVPGEQRLILAPGHQKVLRFPGLRGLATGGPLAEIIDAKTIGEDVVLIIGMKVGRQPLVVFDANGRHEMVVIVVGWPEWDVVICELCRFFSCDSKLETEMVGDQIIINGEVRSVEEWAQVRHLRTLFNNIIVRATLPFHHVDRAVHDANRALWRAGFERSSLYVVGNKVMLNAEVTEGDAAVRLHALTTPWLEHIGALLDFDAPEPTVVPDGLGPSL